MKEMSEISARIFKESPASALQYGVSEGYTPLREAVKARMRDKYHTGTDDDDVLIVTGAQQGMDLVAKCFLNEEDGIICESPSFIGSLNCFPFLPREFDWRTHAAGRHGPGKTGDGPARESKCEAYLHYPDLPEPDRARHVPCKTQENFWSLPRSIMC